MSFAFAKGHLSFAGLFCRLCILLRAKLLPSLFTIRMDPENLESPQVLVAMMMLQSLLSHHHQNRLVCPGFFVEQFVSCWDHP